MAERKVDGWVGALGRLMAAKKVLKMVMMSVAKLDVLTDWQREQKTV
jgi:hypothetical protein